MADVVELRGIWSMGVHGVLPEEQVRAQPFEVDLDIEADLSTAGRTDDLAFTVDYGQVAERVAGVVAGERFRLVERLAHRIAEVVLEDARVLAVEVAVRKLRPPVPVDVSTVGVRIRRTRSTP